MVSAEFLRAMPRFILGSMSGDMTQRAVIRFVSLVSRYERFTLMKTLWNDEAGVILSAELVLIATILVLGMIVGLVELQCSIIAELSDLGSAFGNLNQSYSISGFSSSKGGGQFKARTFGAAYTDRPDICDCDGNLTIVCTDPGEVLK